jgi:hypothetical protein
MKRTSLPCVPTIIAGRKQDRTGRPAIDKHSGSTWDEGDINEAVDRFLKQYAPNGEERMGDLEFTWWNTKAHVRHWFGVHTLVASEVWQKTEEGLLRVVKRGSKCWLCDYREY